MKTLKLTLALFILTVLSTAIYANGRGRNFNNNAQDCISQLTNLTQNQTASIEKLKNKHYQTINELRNERRSTTEEKAKIEIRLKMIAAKEQHQNDVLALLTKEQQATYKNISKNGQNTSSNSNFRNGNNNKNKKNNNCGNRGNSIRNNGSKNGKNATCRN